MSSECYSCILYLLPLSEIIYSVYVEKCLFSNSHFHIVKSKKKYIHNGNTGKPLTFKMNSSSIHNLSHKEKDSNRKAVLLKYI